MTDVRGRSSGRPRDRPEDRARRPIVTLGRAASAGGASAGGPWCGSMAERTVAVEPDPGAWATTRRDLDLEFLVLRSRRRDPCAERLAIELDRRRSPAELAAISERQADTLVGVINAVLDGIGLTVEQRERAVEIAVRELRRAGGEEP